MIINTITIFIEEIYGPLVGSLVSAVSTKIEKLILTLIVNHIVLKFCFLFYKVMFTILSI